MRAGITQPDIVTFVLRPSLKPSSSPDAANAVGARDPLAQPFAQFECHAVIERTSEGQFLRPPDQREQKPIGKSGLTPVMAWISRNTAAACFDKGTECGCRIFVRRAGMLHTAASRSTSGHSANRISPGRTNVKARACK